MPRLNPNLPLRAAIITALTPIGIPVKSKKFPADTKTTKQYILITSQTKKRTAISKDCYDYLCSVVIDINSINTNGVADADSNDVIEEQVVQRIEDGLDIQFFIVKETIFVQSLDLDLETPTYSIQRRIVTYQFWVGQSTT